MARNIEVEGGVSSIKITPKKPVYLAGFDRKSTGHELSRGIHDDLYAKCLLIKVGGRQLGFLALDLIGLFHDDVEKFRRLSCKCGLNPDGVIVSSTHQHSGPDTLGLWGPEPTVSGVDPEYMSFLMDRMVTALAEASGRPRPVRLWASKTEMPKGVAKNSRDPGVLDEEIVILRVEEVGGSNMAVLVNFGLHPEVLWADNDLITSDFPHYMYRTVESEVGGLCIFINGSLGGMVTPLVKERSFKEAERVGSTIGDAILESLDDAEPIEAVRFKLLTERVKLPIRNEKFRTLSDLGVLKRELVDGDVETRLTIATLGNASFLTIPGEPLPKFGLRVKSMMPGEFRFLIALGDDELGYIIPHEDWSPERYEESMSLGPETAPILIDGIKRMISKI